MKGPAKSSIYKINRADPTSLIPYGDLSTTQALNIAAGNQKYLYESTSGKFYELGTGSSVVYTAKSLTDLGIDSLFDSTNVEFTELQGLVLAYSLKNGVTNILPITTSAIAASSALSVSGAAQTFDDAYLNFVAITATDLLWIRKTATSY